jgi:hypothetical protein
MADCSETLKSDAVARFARDKSDSFMTEPSSVAPLRLIEIRNERVRFEAGCETDAQSSQ